MLRSIQFVLFFSAFIFSSQVIAEEEIMDDTPIYEMITWKSKSDISDPVMIDALNTLILDVKTLNGFLHHSLYKNTNDEWVDIYYWKAEKDVHNAHKIMADKTSFKALMELIEPNSLSIEILHSLQSSGELSFSK